ncbi:MAG: GNAT family N-acetyltransferase [Candidatus Latescibacteria bacterium]|jgi:GNAT superfamily N-acetyltransferase|nr:GNAT family N-acetyltransferase [Candidatus Latescibacterota bacterium]
MPIVFTPSLEHPPGTVLRLLREAWAPLWNPGLEANIRAFDREVTDHPETVGACTFVTCLDGEPIGMASFDSRPGPERGLIGWNCIVPEHQGEGWGKAQILEVLRRFGERGIRRACVTTTDEAFFVPAQHTYESCGFTIARRTANNNIEYELDLRGEIGSAS